MARPIKTGLDFFSLDTKLDDEIVLILAKFGAEGFGVLIILWQIIYNNGFYIKWTEKELLLYNNRFYADINKVNDVINECLKWNIFDKNMYEKYSILTSKGIQKRYLTATERRKLFDVDSQFWLLNGVNDNINLINDNINSINTNKSTQKKRKEITVKEINDLWLLYPNKKGKADYLKKAEKLILKYGFEELAKTIKRYDESVKDKKYLCHGSTFFNGKFIDYLDENYTYSKPKKRKEVSIVEYNA